MPKRPLPRRALQAAAAAALLQLAGAGGAPALAAGTPVEVVSVTQPICSQLPDTEYMVCTNVSEVEIRIPAEVQGPSLVQCLLYSQEQQILGVGEAVLRPPGGHVWVVLRPYYRFGQVTLHASTRCQMSQ